MNRHPTVTLRLEVQIDEKIANIVKWCYSRGLNTTYSCQGGSGSQRANLAYLAFAGRGDSTLFAKKVVKAKVWPYGFEYCGRLSKAAHCSLCDKVIPEKKVCVGNIQRGVFRHMGCGPFLWVEGPNIVRFKHDSIPLVEGALGIGTYVEAHP